MDTVSTTPGEPRPTPAEPAKAFAIFRGAEARGLHESGAQDYSAIDPEIMAQLNEYRDATVGGLVPTMVFNGGGFSLARNDYKPGFPVPLHAHNADCLYLLAEGSMKLGTEVLNKGDGMFIPAGTPYQFSAGPEGVVVYEFRAAQAFDISFPSRNPVYWRKMAATADAFKPGWSG